MCQAALTQPLSLDDDVHEHRLAREDDSIIIPTGVSWVVELYPAASGTAPKKEIWFSPLSLTEQVVTNPDAFGCCGYEFRNNTRCKCGYIVGSRLDDCGLQPRFVPNSKMTYWAAAYHDESDAEPDRSSRQADSIPFETPMPRKN